MYTVSHLSILQLLICICIIYIFAYVYISVYMFSNIYMYIYIYTLIYTHLLTTECISLSPFTYTYKYWFLASLWLAHSMASVRWGLCTFRFRDRVGSFVELLIVASVSLMLYATTFLLRRHYYTNRRNPAGCIRSAMASWSSLVYIHRWPVIYMIKLVNIYIYVYINICSYIYMYISLSLYTYIHIWEHSINV